VNLLKDQGQEKLIKDTISCWAYPRGLGGLQPGAKNKESDESKASLPKTEITRGEGGLQPEAKNSDKLVTHCGYCLPCLIRRMAILSCGLEEYDASYARDIMAHFGEVQYQPGGPDYSKTEHFRDLLYFCTRISNIQVEMSKFAKQSKLDVKVFERTRFLMEYPELSLITGNVEMKGVNNPLQEVIDMYKQFSKEVLDTVQDNGDDSLKEWAF
jgi:hypothetical protein